MSYSIYFILGILPSIIWLLFFLRQDADPEPNRVIIKVFFLGIIAALLAAVFECFFFEVSGEVNIAKDIKNIINIFIGVALIEEYFKYLVVRRCAIRDRDFDEPTDVMLYMVIAGLGFAALENTLVFLIPSSQPINIPSVLSLALFRFIGATFLHALTSGLIGFSLAMSFLRKKHKLKIVAAGIAISVFLHGLYNFSIMELAASLKITVPAIILLSLAITVLIAFEKLRNTASICRIKAKK
jgi:RsiW-degrading membrane proteinase PrsW (M82 family)